jgi:predicted transcriptional regulator of viral defense system
MNKSISPITQLKQKVGSTFTRAQALSRGVTRYRLYRLRDEGLIIPIGVGVYRWADAEPADLNLIEIVERCPQATLCLETALAHYDLTDQIPSRINVAVPRESSRVKFIAPVQLHFFNQKTFELGRTTLSIADGREIGLYSAERSVIDTVRLRHSQGKELAWEALRRWLQRKGSSPAKLLRLAEKIHGAEKALRTALEVL